MSLWLQFSITYIICLIIGAFALFRFPLRSGMEIGAVRFLALQFFAVTVTLVVTSSLNEELTIASQLPWLLLTALFLSTYVALVRWLRGRRRHHL